MARHAAGDRVDGVGDFDAFLLQHVGHFLQRVLRLGDGHAIARHDDDLAGILHHKGGVVGRAHLGIALRTGIAGRGAVGAEPAQDHRDEGAVHALAHDVGQDRTGRTDQRTGDEQCRVLQGEAECCGGPAGIGIQHRHHDRHVGAADRDDESARPGSSASDSAISQKASFASRILEATTKIDHQDDLQDAHAPGSPYAVPGRITGVAGDHVALQLGEGDRWSRRR